MKLLKINGNYYLTTGKQTNLCYHIKNKELLTVNGVGVRSDEVHHNKGWNYSNEVWFVDLDKKLSLSNCISIANGSNLENLAEDYAKTDEDIDPPYQNGLFYGFMAGFEKALELVFNQNDKSEWDVEIEIERDYSDRSCATCCFGKENGCDLNKEDCASKTGNTLDKDWWASKLDDEKDSEVYKIKTDDNGCVILKLVR